MPWDDFSIRNFRDQLWDGPADKHACTECKRPCGSEIEWLDASGKGTNTYICEACSDADEAAGAK